MKKFVPKFTITNKTTEALARIERARGFLEASVFSAEWLERMRQRALLLEAHHTTHIEGTQLTLEQAEQLWNGNDVPEVDPNDQRELLNYRHAFQLVVDSLIDELPMSDALIRGIHQQLVEGVRGGQGEPGRYRTIQNYIANSKTGTVIYTPPIPEEVAPLMQQLMQWLRADTEIHPVLVAGIAQFQFVHIHPFVDGNGRTSRLLSTLCLYQSGYDFHRLFTISEYYDRNRPEFYQAIQSVRENDMDMTGWLDYFVTGLATQLEETKLRGTQAIKVDLIAQKHQLNERQIIVLDYLFTQEILTIDLYESICPQNSRRTLQRDLKSLLEKGLLTCEGATNNMIYRLNEAN